MEPAQPVYENGSEPPENLIETISQSADRPPAPKEPAFGLDSPVGLLLSSFASPLYLYATFRGKFQVWTELLSGIPDSFYLKPTLDLGCGRGMVLLKIASLKKQIAEKDASLRVAPAYGIDIFNKNDQTGNSAAATYGNAAAMGVLDYTVLHNASFTERLPFADGVFSLVTASLSIHNASKEGRINAIKEVSRVCAPGGKLVIADLTGFFKAHTAVLHDAGWKNVEVEWAGIRMVFGTLPCQILKAFKPEN